MKRKRALTFFWIGACACAAGAPGPKPSPANHGGGDSPPPAHELRLDVATMPYETEIDPVAPIDLVVMSRVVQAEVLVDGEVVGVTPARVRVPAGKHQIRVYAEGY